MAIIDEHGFVGVEVDNKAADDEFQKIKNTQSYANLKKEAIEGKHELLHHSEQDGKWNVSINQENLIRYAKKIFGITERIANKQVRSFVIVKAIADTIKDLKLQNNDGDKTVQCIHGAILFSIIYNRATWTQQVFSFGFRGYSWDKFEATGRNVISRNAGQYADGHVYNSHPQAMLYSMIEAGKIKPGMLIWTKTDQDNGSGLKWGGHARIITGISKQGNVYTISTLEFHTPIDPTEESYIIKNSAEGSKLHYHGVKDAN